MQESHEERITVMLPPQVKNNGAFDDNAPLDLAGVGEAYVQLIKGASDAAVGSGDATTAPILEECDTLDGDYAEIEGAELSEPIAAGADAEVYRIDVPMRDQRKRYVRVKAPTAENQTDGAHLTIVGVARKLAHGPATAAERGLAEHIVA